MLEYIDYQGFMLYTKIQKYESYSNNGRWYRQQILAYEYAGVSEAVCGCARNWQDYDTDDGGEVRSSLPAGEYLGGDQP